MDIEESFDVTSLFGALGSVRTFPDIEIVTERVRLRAYTPADVDAHLAIFDHAVARRWSIVPQPYTRTLAEQWCRAGANSVRTSGDGICWAVEERSTGQLVGLTGLHHTHWDNGVTEVSADGAASALGRGYATQALRAISHWVLARQGFNRIRIRAAVGNRAPQLVAMACGFVREGVLRNAQSHRTGPLDMAVFSLVPNDLRNVVVPDYLVRPAREPHLAIA